MGDGETQVSSAFRVQHYGARGPCSGSGEPPHNPEADRILSLGGVVILPDVLISAGGVVVSYFEWTQNIQEFDWEESHVNEELEKIMLRAYHDVRERSRIEGITHRQSSFEIGVQRVVRAVELRGFV